MKCFIFFAFFLFLHTLTYSQCVSPITSNCDALTSNMLPDAISNVDFSFDSFKKYVGGIEQYGSTILKLKVEDNLALTCHWKLTAIVSNNGWVGGANQWNNLATYGLGAGNNPTIDLLYIRVSNSCSTPNPLINNTWTAFPLGLTGDVIDIINDAAFNPGTPANCGGVQVNGAGSYLGPNYGEYSFTVDYKIVPGYNFKPGYYNLSIAFCLTED